MVTPLAFVLKEQLKTNKQTKNPLAVDRHSLECWAGMADPTPALGWTPLAHAQIVPPHAEALRLTFVSQTFSF